MTKRIEPEHFAAVAAKNSWCDTFCRIYNNLAREVNAAPSTSIDLDHLFKIISWASVAQSWLQDLGKQLSKKPTAEDGENTPSQNTIEQIACLEYQMPKKTIAEGDENGPAPNVISDPFTARDGLIACLKATDKLAWDIYDGEVKIKAYGHEFQTPRHLDVQVGRRIEAVLRNHQAGGWSDVRRPVDGQGGSQNEV